MVTEGMAWVDPTTGSADPCSDVARKRWADRASVHRSRPFTSCPKLEIDRSFRPSEGKTRSTMEVSWQ